MNEDLPSINDFIEDKSNLPSINESIDADLPSYKDFLEKEEEVITEETGDNIVVNMDGGVGGSWSVEETPEPQTVVHEKTIIREVQDNSTIISLIEQVRDSIPEVKTYDKELFDLVNLIEEVRKEIPVVPEPPSIPEVKYYDDEIESLKEEVKSVSERDIPDFRWISKSFTTIDEDIDSVNSNLSILKNRLDMEISDLVESIDVAKFESGVETKSLSEKYESVDSKVDEVKENLTETVTEVKDRIWKELRDTSLRIWELRNEIKEDDKKFRKEVSGQYKELGLNISEIVETTEQKYSDLNNYLDGIKTEISNLPEVPEVKYYDEEIEEVSKSVRTVTNLVGELENKLNKKIEGLKESILVNPPENNTDPLTPLDQNFATLDDLSNHYRLFINRIQTQLASIGGGGETRLEFLDDIDRDTVLVDGKVIAYQASTGKFIGVTNSGGGGGGIANTSDVRDAIQGYYGYTTDYYTVGVANTFQEIGAGVTTLIEPQVAAVYQYLPTVMTGVGTNPYIGNTATTIGTGQTEFSLAGLSSGASCIVRTALAFDPDEDNTTLDIQLKFTTNTATQGTGLTNFTVLKENALIMQVGGDQQYISENVFSFFVGSTLEGTTYSDAGSFSIEVIPSNDGDLEVLAVTVNVIA